ncbi:MULTISPECIES: plasmid replication protein RepC [Brucella]|uniref:plasmid replication protein RepC n=1 Tax=Brucella TaxID=234 RepID=UPI00128E8626|nr:MULTISPECIES: plasmid replication protein RepC [Brucella]MCR8494130.1 replication initiation protein RepC [Brucella anthropi]MPR64322.1 replication initiation protein RepC [Brucella intermedia]
MQAGEYATTPFGSRPMTLASLAAQRVTRESEGQGRAVDKWALYKDICEAKSVLGTNDRALAVLSALLSFYPDSELSEENGLIVFPSNRQLSLRAHGMPDTSLRRNLASLVDAGLILRRDSPNGKRYAHKSREGDIEEAFGLSLAPLLARADEIAQAADQVRAEAQRIKRTRERITLQRRDISKLIEVAVEEVAEGDWSGLWRRFRAIVDAIPRRASITELETILDELVAIRVEVDNALNSFTNDQNMDGNDVHTGRQHTESNPDSHFELEPAPETSGVEVEPKPRSVEPPKGYPLGLILKACPDIIDYAVDGIASWRDLMATAAQVRGYLGVSPSAYADALDILGQENTAVVIACILQRANHINSAGGYLRALTDKARAGGFSVGPMLMAQLKTNGVTTSRMAG